MSERKPAHEVVVEMIDETVGSLLESLNDPNPNCDKPEVESVHIILMMGILGALIETLKRMIIPQKEMEWVISEIRRIRAKLPAEYAEKLLPVKFILGIAQSE